MKNVLYIFISAILLSACDTKTKSTNLLFEKIDKQGHRGCRGLMPENTIPAFKKAIDLGVNTLEMDVVITLDNKVIVSHENYFNYETTTLPDGKELTLENQEEYNIYRMPYSDIQKYDVGLKYNPKFPKQQKIKAFKPLLSDLIDTLEAYAKKNNKPILHYNIETKLLPETDSVFHPGPKVFVDLLLNVVFEKKIENRLIIQSFDKRTLQYLHSIHPEIKTSLLVEDFDKKPFAQQMKELGYIPTIYSPAYQLVNPQLVAECKTKNVKLIPWTVNDRETMVKMVDLGVDGILSDYPNLFFE